MRSKIHDTSFFMLHILYTKCLGMCRIHKGLAQILDAVVINNVYIISNNVCSVNMS